MTFAVTAVVATVTTLTLSLLLPFAVKPMLMKLGIMDVPNERSSHVRPVLRGLGLAVLIAMAVGYMVGLSTQGVDQPGWISLLIIGVGAVLSGLLGLREDLQGLSVPVRSAVLLVIGAGSAIALIFAAERAGGVQFAWVAGMPVTDVSMITLVILVIYAVLFVSSYINVANFVDGLNGISGFHGVIAGLAFAIAGLIVGEWWLVVSGGVLAAGYAGFLPWNFSKTGAFLGDVGSYLLGGATAITSFAALLAGVPLLATIGPMIICFGDVGFTLVQRVRAGKKWDEPHKEHVYQRIQQLGYSHAQASGITAGFSLLAAALGLLSCFTGVIGTLVLLISGLALLAVYIALPKLLPTA